MRFFALTIEGGVGRTKKPAEAGFRIRKGQFLLELVVFFEDYVHAVFASGWVPGTRVILFNVHFVRRVTLVLHGCVEVASGFAVFGFSSGY